jgi:hypothetical protein
MLELIVDKLELLQPVNEIPEVTDSVEKVKTDSGTASEACRVFISHSSNDARLAERLVDLLRSALNLKAAEIRCTSVEGHRLPVGTPTDESLREEILKTEIFIGLISPSSMESAYVLFELGARWGAKLHLLPLLAPGSDSSLLKGPVAGLSALSCSNSAQLHQLINDMGKKLNIDPANPAAYQKHLDRIIGMTT